MMVTSPYKIGATDIRWDNPTIIPQNGGLKILGVNVYRSINNPYGPYELLTQSGPVGSLFYRDETIENRVIEDATPTIKHLEQPDGRWFVYTQHKPIVIPNSNGKVCDNPQDIQVQINNGDGNLLIVPAFKVQGAIGEITLIDKPIYNYEVNQIIPARLPYPPNGRVTIIYSYIQNWVLSKLSQRIYYKVTTVALNQSGDTIETPIEEVEWRSISDIEEIDWIFREAILRNRWILEQGGERVKIFTRKSMGKICPEYDRDHGQSHDDCRICKGTRFIGGYDGPFETIIAPPEAEKNIELTTLGLHLRYEYETWMGPFPLINERDVIVRQNNERYIVGPVNPTGIRGATFQQSFTISHLDDTDIRYSILIEGGQGQVPASTDAFREPLQSPASPVIPVKPFVPLPNLIKGKTVNFENITF
jgi:hypothetical protein